MDLLGPSLSECVKNYMTKDLPIAIVMVIAEETFRIIEAVHKAGIVHRDIKPSNFLLRPHSPKPLCLTDFGVSKIHIVNGKVVPQVNGRFVGTGRYASLNAFRRLDVGRGDDLMSWFYMICELGNGRLPWKCKRGTEKEVIMAAKQAARVWDMIGVLPRQFGTIYESICGLKYEDCPDYELIRHTMKEIRSSPQIRIEGNEWKLLWELDPERDSLIRRKPGDEVYDRFDPRKVWRDSVEGGCCGVM
jgi:serine/threonine protein kinase